MVKGKVLNYCGNSFFKFYLLYFLIITALAFLFPASGDDLGWATSDGWELFENGFKNYNGRYLGNISALFFTRIPYILPFIKGFTLTLILALIQKLSGSKSKEFLYISASVVAIPIPLFIQGFIWTAGFSNYYFSSMIIMFNLFLVFCKRDLTGYKNVLRILCIFILGTAGQLFMETYTIFSLLISFAANVYFYLKNKKVDLASIVYSAACIIGSVIMFSNGIYMKVLSGEDVYQTSAISGKMTGGFVWEIIEKFFGKVSFYYLMACMPAIVLILSFAAGILKNSSAKVKKAVKNLSVVFAAIMLVFVSAVLIFKTQDKLIMISGIISIYLFILCLIFISVFHSRKAKMQTIAYCFMIIILSAPLMVVSPVGHRCFVLPFLIMVLILKEFYREYKTIKNASEKPSWIKKAKISFAVLVVLNFSVYTTVYISNCQKIERLRTETEKGNYSIELKHTTLGFMVNSLDIENKHPKCLRRFCEYYGLPYDIEITYTE